jgi:hypothetical protein
VSARGWSLLLALGLGALVVYAGLNRPWSYTVENKTADGRFFKVDVKLSYKGEPHPISFVVGCRVHGVKYADGSSTRDVGLIPTLYGHRMKDGQAIVVRPPDVCAGETTANGEVPKNFMPVIIVYDNADTLDFGKAYVSDDAYEGPLSELTYESTTITASDRAAWEEFRANGPPNVVTRERYWSAVSAKINMKLGPGKPPVLMAVRCHFAVRIELSEAAKALVSQSVFDKKSKPWELPEDPVIQDPPLIELINITYRNVIILKPEADEGVPRRAGGPPFGLLLNWGSDGRLSDIFPVNSQLAGRNWPGNPELVEPFLNRPEGFETQQIDTENDRNRGFAYCYEDAAYFDKFIIPAMQKNAGRSVIDGETVIRPNDRRQNLYELLIRVFVGTRYVFTIYHFGVTSMNGDV